MQSEQVAAQYSLQHMSSSSDAAKAKVLSLDVPPKLYIADGLYGLGKAPWDSIDKKWKKDNYKSVIELAKVINGSSNELSLLVRPAFSLPLI